LTSPVDCNYSQSKDGRSAKGCTQKSTNLTFCVRDIIFQIGQSNYAQNDHHTDQKVDASQIRYQRIGNTLLHIFPLVMYNTQYHRVTQEVSNQYHEHGKHKKSICNI
jgi:hypothetical protein